MTVASAEGRVRQLVEAAVRLSNSADAWGQRARERLGASTGLSAAGVEWGLTRCLETRPSAAEISALCRSVPTCERAHVLLSANVFVAAHRAIALALACSSSVAVRPSRREREMAALLAEATGGLFRLVDELLPSPGEHVWAYGNDATLDSLRGQLPAGVVLHAHGTGLGVAALELAEDMSAAAQALAQDVIAFDQRGCLSPRVALVRADPQSARAFAVLLAETLTSFEEQIPRGQLTREEAADQARFRDALCYAGDIWPAGKGWVTLDGQAERLVVAPIGRNVHVVAVRNVGPLLAQLAPLVAGVGVHGSERLWEEIGTLLPRARISALGKMQCPRFDGPVDRRPDPAGELM